MGHWALGIGHWELEPPELGIFLSLSPCPPIPPSPHPPNAPFLLKSVY